jgi:secreted trypsin-like serine protease
MLASLVAVLAVAVGPATAVTDGELDGNRHPAVVLILMEVNGAPAYRCSGTLIAPTYVITAGHCAGEPGEFSGIRVFTESDVDAGKANGTNNYPYGGGASVEATRWAAHPQYTSAAFFLHDVGMIELAEPINLPSSEYGELPTVNQLDSLKKRKQTTFTAVGYGLQKSFPDAAGWKTEANRVRMLAHPHLIQINGGIAGDFSLLLSNNANTGGTCFGDSGGPNFLGGDDSDRTIAAVTSFGLNGTCGGTGGVFRIDRQNVLDFVNDFMNP